MRSALRKILNTLLRFIPSRVLQRAIQRDCIAVFYHAVSDEPMPHVELLYPPISAPQFEQDLLYLKQNFNPITYDQLQARVFDGGPIPPRAVHLSFDDGYLECFTVVRPLLLKHQVPCTFFITTDWIDNHQMFYRNKASLSAAWVQKMGLQDRQDLFARIKADLGVSLQSANEFSNWIRSLPKSERHVVDRVSELVGLVPADFLKNTPLYMSRDHIEQLGRDGFTLASHTRAHHKLVNLDAESIEAEIVESSKIIREIAKADVVPFSFPNSAMGIDRPLLRDIRSRHPFLGLFFDTKGIQRDEPYLINRIWAERIGQQPRNPRRRRLARLIGDAYRAEASNLLWQRLKR